MANAEVDISSLTEEQQLALQQFTSVTDQELLAAVPLLQKCEWNVQIAIARFFDGEPVDPIAEEPSDALPSQTSRRTDTLANTFTTTYRRPSPQSQYEAAPRIVSQPASQINQQPGFLFSLFLTPANILYNLLSRVFNIIGYLLPFLPRLLSRLNARTNPSVARNAGGRRPLGPQDTTGRFLREFEEEHGNHSLPFLETGYSRAFDLAKRDLKFLIAIPLAPEHDATAPFIKNILLSEPVLAFLNDSTNNTLLWAGTTQDSEPFQVASSLNITRFPTAAVIAHTPAVSSSAMSVIARISAPTSVVDFLARLQAAIQQHAPSLARARSSRTEQQASRDLRQQQESAYERSLAQDRERARQKKEAETEKIREEKAQRDAQERADRYARDLTQWRRWRAAQLPAEPGAAVNDAVRISLRLLNGERVMRKFAPEARIEDVYACAECWDALKAREEVAEEKESAKPIDFEHEYDFQLVSPMPRQVYELADGGSVKEKIGRSGNLIVERIEADEYDDVG